MPNVRKIYKTVISYGSRSFYLNFDLSDALYLFSLYDLSYDLDDLVTVSTSSGFTFSCTFKDIERFKNDLFLKTNKHDML